MTTSSEFLDVAAALAEQIADDAIWHGERCNWIGVSPHDPAPTRGRTVVEALGPDLYNGTAGVALFLAEAAAALGDARLERSAHGALRHALEHAGRIAGDGLHAGPPGIAYAAARVATALDSEPALRGARDVLRAWRRGRRAATAWDVIGGCAGAVSALVALSELVEDPTLLGMAAIAGDELIAAAERSNGGWLWTDSRRASMHGLCGFAHGAAGIGHALLELWNAGGQTRFRDAGTAAFDYERSWFDRRGTWPDLREIERRAGYDVPVRPAPSWCNGVPGIALSRLRATRLVGSEAVRRDAHVALALTREHVAELSLRAPDDFSLCHGAAGAADVLLYAADTSGLAERIGVIGIERHRRTASTFPCGIPYGETPGLFLGLAGIGLFYLRLSDPAIPTALVIHRRA